MQHEFWHERWQSNQIAFHQGKAHDLLTKYVDSLGDLLGKTILVPLCGKSLDLVYLVSRGANVIGCELSNKACVDFFTENSLEYEVINQGGFEVYVSKKIIIYCGDFFAIDFAKLPQIDFVYDRAALIALPITMRKQYADHLKKLKSVKYLLITLSYPSDEEIGPPFSVSQKEVVELYSDKFMINELEKLEITNAPNSRLFMQGIAQSTEAVYLLVSK
ncbi:MAG: thiopurine S-methyltransferase [Neisseriaceae bacterium]|nr:MAG: thiopurine S-methyltransferase [Neisseriaceae bacterium]